MKRFLGFTLAEVLITLGIIGVVAALTMPTLVANYKKQVYVNQLKGTVSLFSQAITKYMADEGIDDLTLVGFNENEEKLKYFFNNYLKVVNDCEGRYYTDAEHRCFAKTYRFVSGNRTPVNMQSHSCAVVVNLANGTSVCADVARGTVTGGDPDDSHTNNGVVGQDTVISFEVDINGSKGPNQFNRDFFAFSMLANGRIYDPTYIETGAFDKTAGPNSGAFGYLLSNGWNMDY